MHPVLFLDLDDTLYLERDYVLSGFRAVADHLAAQFAQEPEPLFKAMEEILDREGRGRIFDRVLDQFGISTDQQPVADLVDLYRGHRPRIACFPGVDTLLAHLRTRLALAVVTDGLPAVQRAKVAALGLEAQVDVISYCWAVDAPKPEIGGYVAALDALGASAQGCAVVGDNPAHDGVAARQLGVPFIRVMQGRFAGDPGDADAVIPAITGLEDALRSLELLA